MVSISLVVYAGKDRGHSTCEHKPGIVSLIVPVHIVSVLVCRTLPSTRGVNPAWLVLVQAEMEGTSHVHDEPGIVSLIVRDANER